MSYGDKCESSLKDLGKVTATCDTGKAIITDVPATWGLLNGGAGGCASGVATLFIDEYDRSSDGYGKLSKINVVVLAGVYLIISIVMVAYVMFAGVFDQYLGYTAILKLFRLDGEGRSGLMRTIVIAATTSLMDVLAIIALFSGMWMLSGATPSGRHYKTADDVQSEGVVAYLIPLGLLTALCTLTVVSRITRAVRGDEPSRAAKFVTLVCSTLLIVLVCNAYLERSHIDQLLCTGVVATIIAFELAYLVGRVMNLEADAALIGLKALVVVGVLYISSRRMANFNAGHRDLADATPRDKVEGSPLYQLGPKGDMCNFLYTDMLKPDTDSSSMSDQWHPYRPTSSVTAGKQWSCKADSGSNGNALRLVIILPLVFYVIAMAMTQGALGLSNFQERLMTFVGPMSQTFRQRGFARSTRTAAPAARERRQYTRIRVGQGP